MSKEDRKSIDRIMPAVEENQRRMDRDRFFGERNMVFSIYRCRWAQRVAIFDRQVGDPHVSGAPVASASLFKPDEFDCVAVFEVNNDSMLFWVEGSGLSSCRLGWTLTAQDVLDGNMRDINLEVRKLWSLPATKTTGRSGVFSIYQCRRDPSIAVFDRQMGNTPHPHRPPEFDCVAGI